MKRVLAVVPLAVSAVLVLAGCGDFRERAAAVEERLGTAERSAAVAETAATQNAINLMALERRLEELETEVGLLRAAMEPDFAPEPADETE